MSGHKQRAASWLWRVGALEGELGVRVNQADMSLRGGATGDRLYETCPLEARIV